MIIQEKKENVSDYLLDLIKKDIFNEVALELNNNIKIHKLSNATNLNYLILRNTTIRLPRDNKTTIIYKLDLSNTSGLIFTKSDNFPYKSSTWKSLIDYCNDNNVTLDIFDKDNKLVHKSAIKINSIISNNTLYLAIETNLLYKLDYDYDSLFVNIYRDSSVLNKKLFYTYDSSVDDISVIDDLILIAETHTNKDNIYLYIDGFYYTYTQFIAYTNTINKDNISYIDLYIDTNVFISHIFNSVNDLKFYTTPGLIEKYVLHIPKSKNLSTKMFTFDTIDVFLINPDNGIRYSYFDISSVSQLTFSDISINKALVDEMMINLGLSDMSIEIKIRHYYKNNVLNRNKTYIDILYNYYSDENIIDILSENSEDERLNCIWGGNNLELSEYAKALFVYPKISDVDEFIAEALEIYGYYELSTIINNTNHEFLNLSDNTTELEVEKNVFYNSEVLYPLLTKNGLLSKEFTYTQDSENIDITLTVAAHSEDKIHVKSIPNIINEYVYITPNAGNDTLIINKAAIASSLIGVKVFLANTQDSELVDIDNTPLSIMYIPIENTDETYFEYEETETDITITFKVGSYGLDFVIGYDDHFSHHIQKIDIDLTNESEFTFMLTDSLDRPYLYIPQILIFLNNRLLIDKIDFHIVEFINIDNSIGGYRVIIQNIKYLEALNNVDVFISSLSNHVLFQQKNFLLDNTISCDYRLDTNIENMTISLDGKILNSNDYEFRDITLVPIGSFLESDPYQFEMLDSKACRDWLYGSSLETDCGILGVFTEGSNLEYIRHTTVISRDMLANLDKFFTENIVLASPEQDVLIEILSNCDNTIAPTSMYEIHSSYTNEILQLLDDGIIVIPPSIYNSENPDPIDIDSLLFPYEYLKTFDLVIGDNVLQNKFIEIVLAYDQNLITNGPEGTSIILDHIQETYFNII